MEGDLMTGVASATNGNIVLSEVAPQIGSQQFAELCAAGGLVHDGVQLVTVPWSELSHSVFLSRANFDAARVASYLRLQRLVFEHSTLVRNWINGSCTELGRLLNGVVAPHGDTPLWCRGDEIPLYGGSTAWAEAEVDDGGLGHALAMERCFLRTDFLRSAYIKVFERVGWSRDLPLVMVVGASNLAYLPWMRYLAQEVAAAARRPLPLLWEEDADFAEQIRRAVDAGALVHNFFDCFRNDRFLNPALDPLLEAWRAGRVRMWPPPTVFHEWKGWPVVFHHPERLEPEAKKLLVNDPAYAEVLRYLPRAWFLADLELEDLIKQRVRFIVKPAFGGGSYGVRAGSEMSAGRMRRHVRSLAQSHPVIVQELASSQRFRERHAKVSPHYFFGVDLPTVAHVMTRPSRVVHGQHDTTFTVVTV